MTSNCLIVWSRDYDRFLTWSLREGCLYQRCVVGGDVWENMSALFGYWYCEVRS